MEQPKRVVALLGTYRKGGTIDTVVSAMLESAQASGAEVEKIYLIDQKIEFCTNCRVCTQATGETRGDCIFQDDMELLLDKIDDADALILASPMNAWTVTAVMKRFIERTVVYYYWPWGAHGPKLRSKLRTKKGAVVTSSAAPAFVANVMTSMRKMLKEETQILGADVLGAISVGMAANKVPSVQEKLLEKARSLGEKLVKG